jgi:hypothetical protein
LLLDDAVDDLNALDVALGHGGVTLGAPADVGAQRDAVVADLAFLDQRIQRLEDGVVVDGLDARVVELVEVDVVGAQPLEAVLAGLADELGFPALAAFLVVPPARGLEVVAELGGDDDVLALLLREGVAEDLLAVAVSVGVGGVEEGYALFDGVAEEVDGVVVFDFTPPAGGDGPDAEGDF